MIKIPLRDDKVAIIDNENAELVLKHTWHLHVVLGKYLYASTNVRLPLIKERKYRIMKMHRLIMNAEPGQVVDHINGNGLDCRRTNMRICTQRQNASNIGSARGTSRFKGVSWQSSRGKWLAAICCDRTYRNLGRFDCEIEAAKAYNEAAATYFGEFARLNIIPA